MAGVEGWLIAHKEDGDRGFHKAWENEEII